jgi:aryl-alcohol dehydrogenase-like predicted oxidoreductase
VLAKGEDTVPIPGTKRVKYLDDNLGAVNVSLSRDELAQIDALLSAGVASGERYHAQAMKAIDRQRP